MATDHKFWFHQDRLTDDITSMSCGTVWLYFYKETLIGIRDMAENAAWFLDHGDVPTQSDGLTHAHEITEDVIRTATRESFTNCTTQTVTMNDLTEIAYSKTLGAFERDIDEHFIKRD